jgi:hypothetical protein
VHDELTVGELDVTRSELIRCRNAHATSP